MDNRLRLQASVVRTFTVAPPAFDTVTLDWSTSTRWNIAARWALVELQYAIWQIALADPLHFIAPVVTLSTGGWASEKICIPHGTRVLRADRLPDGWNGTISVANPDMQSAQSNETFHVVVATILQLEEPGAAARGRGC